MLTVAIAIDHATTCNDKIGNKIPSASTANNVLQSIFYTQDRYFGLCTFVCFFLLYQSLSTIAATGPYLGVLFQGGVYDAFADKMSVQSFICRQVSRICQRNTPIWSNVYETQFFPCHVVSCRIADTNWIGSAIPLVNSRGTCTEWRWDPVHIRSTFSRVNVAKWLGFFLIY